MNEMILTMKVRIYLKNLRVSNTEIKSLYNDKKFEAKSENLYNMHQVDI